MSFSAVNDFEIALAQWWNAPYCVATDCCTHAIELCLRADAEQIENTQLTVPDHTYISIPFTLQKLNLDWSFDKRQWIDYYSITNTRIIDSAVYWQAGGYIPNTLQCLSFQFKKPLNLGRGGAILCDNKEDYVKLKKLAYDGRYGDTAWKDQDISTIGYHYYMTPETATEGLKKLPHTMSTKTWSYNDYPDLNTYSVFK
jgi:dTDP-4-amino-4,6-dideoxygalactose transaminase|tara:strand:+ start:752 stop:1348 length:597 start_codon:yes stop_codon:yes gene_type:complete